MLQKLFRVKMMELMSLLILLSSPSLVLGNWQEWWTYDGISGPWYWGVINPSWAMCAKGKKQSPINIDPKALIYDPSLKDFSVDKRSLDGLLENTGQFLVFKMESDRLSKMPVNITGGPLAYRYQFEKMIFHWGNDPGGDLREDSSASPYRSVPGSEHRIDGKAFPAEIQLYGFNAHLFKNLSEAVVHPHGVVGISILVQEALGDRGASRGLLPITSQLEGVTYKGSSIPVSNLNLGEILPDTEHYMTYEGSTTYPGCWETVSWIILNKPLFLSRSELQGLRQLMRGDRLSPKAPLGKNIRILQGLNSRSVRTNINFQAPKRPPKKQSSSLSCPDVLSGFRFTTSSWIHSLEP